MEAQERAQGKDPVNELKMMDFQEYVRPYALFSTCWTFCFNSPTTRPLVLRILNSVHSSTFVYIWDTLYLCLDSSAGRRALTSRLSYTRTTAWHLPSIACVAIRTRGRERSPRWTRSLSAPMTRTRSTNMPRWTSVRAAHLSHDWFNEIHTEVSFKTRLSCILYFIVRVYEVKKVIASWIITPNQEL